MMQEPRLGNLITVLLPARIYKINCAWTTEKLMPGIEQFACRLLLIFERLYPSELQNFFGLNDREREVLLESLLENRLITISPDGHIEASAFLRKHAAGNDGKPSLIKYQDRTEEVAFDLLTLTICKPQPPRRITSGLPELLPKYKVGSDTTAVTEAFSSQYRHHLMLSRNNEYERQRTKLYKVMGCSSHEMVQLPIEIEVSYDPALTGEPHKYTRSYEIIGNSRLPLVNELEAHIADFLGEHRLDNFGVNCEEYCNLVEDHVMAQFCDDYKFNFSGWMDARSQRKTGYGNQQTIGILGAIYLPDNSKRFFSTLHDALRNHDGKLIPKALWYSSKVPLWGANGNHLPRFNRDLGQILENYADDKIARISLLHSGDSEAECRLYRKHHSGRFANGVALSSEADFDRMEMLLIPGVIGLVQYHGQPNNESALTLPIGYMTVDPQRLQLLEKLLLKRTERAIAKVSWYNFKHESLDTLLPVEMIAKFDKRSGEEVDQAIRSLSLSSRSSIAQAILSLRKNI